MRRFLAVLATLLPLLVAVQFFLAASGAFDTAEKDEAFRPHRALGYGILLLAVLVTAAAAAARAPGRLVGLSGLVAGLALLQGVIRMFASALDTDGGSSTAGELVFGLHAVNALAIMAVSGLVARQARQLSAAPEPARQGP